MPPKGNYVLGTAELRSPWTPKVDLCAAMRTKRFARPSKPLSAGRWNMGVVV